MKATPLQNKLLQMAQQKGGTFTKSDAVQLIGGKYYCNEDKHVGDVLSRMVNAGFLVRVKPGHFELPKHRVEKVRGTEIDPAQSSLF